MTAAATRTRKPLTDTTWATLAADQAYLSADYAQRRRLSWPALADLGAELAATAGLPVADARVLVDLCVSQVPVILTWTTGDQTTTAAVIVEYLGPRTMHVRYCGFSHPVHLADVVSATTFQTVRTRA